MNDTPPDRRPDRQHSGEPRRATSQGRDRQRGRPTAADATGPPRPPALYRLVRDRSGQATTIGVALMLAIAAIGVTAVVALGGTALTDSQESVDVQRTEHAMTLLDSRGAMAALGESQSQRVVLSGSGDGSYEIDADAGWIRVVHKNFTDPTPSEETIFNRSLGTVRYTRGDAVVAYQGGGVWRTQDGGSVMISPPEFHYRDQTLTMPLVRVAGSGSASGRITAEVSPVSTGTDVRRIFPNETANTANGPGAPYDDAADTSYDNPVTNGTVVVTVHSEHYRAWATYFDERTEGFLTVDDANQTASIELRTLAGAPGAFDMPLVGESLETPSVAKQHNVTQFDLQLAPDTSNANAFNQLHWSLYYQGPSGQQFEIHFAGQGRCDTATAAGFTKGSTELSVSLYYRHNSSAPSEEWERVLSDPSDQSKAIHVDCSSGAPRLDADLTSSSFDMEYTDIDIKGSDNKWHFGNQIKDQEAPEELTFDQHVADHADDYEKDDDSEAVGFLIDHYFSRLGPDFRLTVDAGPGGSQNRVSEEASSGVLLYDTIDGEEFIQFLHITENEVRVELNG
ncbi:DUF7289 family protein [Salinigranum halophilum]|uniref:DUF7289 family protein n=1 Tax=Salinigranum halophilum TaxID=2565931 RepID=UPI001F23B923|nr:hypothetical protein [Salinigranum halophilum]